jgi:hypothetical protein
MNQKVTTLKTGRRPARPRSRGRGNAGTVLGLDKSAASKRYTRALERLKEILTAMPGQSREG